jgi:hypothetical protein
MSPRFPRALRRTISLSALLALTLAACGAPDERKRGTYDPRVPVAACLRDEGVSARLVDRTAVDVKGVRIEFLTTPGQAEALSIQGRAQDAEQIGRALIRVGRAPDGLLATIEDCVDA